MREKIDKNKLTIPIYLNAGRDLLFLFTLSNEEAIIKLWKLEKGLREHGYYKGIRKRWYVTEKDS